MHRIRPNSIEFKDSEIRADKYFRTRAMFAVAGFLGGSMFLMLNERSAGNVASASVSNVPRRRLRNIGRITLPVNWELETSTTTEASTAINTTSTTSTTTSTSIPTQNITPVPNNSTFDSGVNWDGIAQCETGGNWSMSGSSFSGGVGFANGTWSSAMHGNWAWKGLQDLGYSDNAGGATREQQIVVAERVYDEFGLSGWGCRAFG